MAIYTSLDHLTKRLDAEILAGLADDVNTPPSLDGEAAQAVVAQAIADGASLIDSYLLGRINLADALACAALERINATLALYFLYQRRYVDDSLNPLAAAREAVQAHLADVAQGRARLAEGSAEAPELTVLSTTAGAERVLRDGALRRF
jgi:phage gp36-like protein